MHEHGSAARDGQHTREHQRQRLQADIALLQASRQATRGPKRTAFGLDHRLMLADLRRQQRG